ncbi:MAG: TrbI/VirB10 family protein [Asticcacaulis sp.]
MAPSKSPAQALPPGNDPRTRMDPDDLEAASLSAMPQVARRGGMGDGVGLAAGLVGIAGLGLITFFSLGHSPAPKPQPPAQQVVTPPPPSVLGPVNPEANPPMDQTPPQSLLVAPPAAIQQPVAPAATPPADSNAARAPALVIDNSVAPPPAAPAAGLGRRRCRGCAGDAQRQRPVRRPCRWRRLPEGAEKIGEPSKVVPQGAVIPAVLETAINSDLPGYTRAIVSQDIRSFDGSTVLIPRGSRLVGPVQERPDQRRNARLHHLGTA